MHAPGSISIHGDTTGPWVSVVFLDGDDYHACEDYSEADHGTMGDYMTQWDYGTETDGAHTTDGASWGSSDRVWTETIGGLDYVVAVNFRMGYASLNRRPLDQ